MDGLERFGLERGCVDVKCFERDFEDGARGCYTSHLAVYREALAQGAAAALVAEDNLAYYEEQEAVAGGPLAWAKEKEGEWDVLHLALVHSAASLRLLRTGDGEVVRVERTAPDWYGPVPIEKAPGLGTTAYLISREAMQKLVDLDSKQGYVGTPIDDLLTSSFPESTFAACPVLLHRDGSESRINQGQGAFRAVMYNPSVFRFVERALVTTGLSSSALVWLFLATMAGWTVGVTLPVARLLLGS